MSAISTPSPSQIAIGFAGAAVAYLGFKAYGLYTYRRDAPASGPVPAGKTRICIAGAYSGPHDARAHKLAAAIAAAYPEKYETWFYWTGISQFYEYVIAKFETIPFPAHLKGHCTHPFVWIETGADQKIEPIGGRDFFCEWTLKNFPAADAPNATIVELASTKPSFGDAFSHVKAMAGSTAECAQTKSKAK